ncbi:hypothetical protein C8F01DRAFT_574058 [Mycena amicta]|nr:hypothetical protein C8F01DRAFT_574058 [Mycena amicta]
MTRARVRISAKQGYRLSLCPPSRKLRMPKRIAYIPAHPVFPFPPSLTNSWPMSLALPWTPYFLSSDYHGEQTTDRRCHVIASTDGTWSRERHLRSARGDTGSHGHQRTPSAYPSESRPAPTHLYILCGRFHPFLPRTFASHSAALPRSQYLACRACTQQTHPPSLRPRSNTRNPSSPSPSTHLRRSPTNDLPRRRPPHSRRPRHPHSRSIRCGRRPSRLSTNLPREVVISSSTRVVLPPIERRIRPSPGAGLVNAEWSGSTAPATVHRLRDTSPLILAWRFSVIWRTSRSTSWSSCTTLLCPAFVSSFPRCAASVAGALEVAFGRTRTMA